MQKEELQKKIIIDANIFLNYFLENEVEQTIEFTENVIKNVINSEIRIFLPDIVIVEVMYNLKKKTSTKSGFDNVAQLFLDLLKNQNVWIHKIDTKELESIKEISQNFNISFYDACYLYLSINLGYPLITMDKPFYKRIIKDYPDTILVG